MRGLPHVQTQLQPLQRLIKQPHSQQKNSTINISFDQYSHIHVLLPAHRSGFGALGAAGDVRADAERGGAGNGAVRDGHLPKRVVVFEERVILRELLGIVSRIEEGGESRSIQIKFAIISYYNRFIGFCKIISNLKTLCTPTTSSRNPKSRSPSSAKTNSASCSSPSSTIQSSKCTKST